MKITFEITHLEELKKYMKELSGGYQIYNKFTFPITPEGLVLSKLKNLNYKMEDFYQKTVTDLGCCLGFFSFYSSFLGAKKVIGYDYNSDYLDFNNTVLEYDSLNSNNYKNKVFFFKKSLTELPELEKNDIILAHSIIHWLIILNENISYKDVIKWLFDNCNYAVYIEGCLDADDSTMKRYSITKERINLNSFIDESKKIFSKVDIIGNMDYCDTRVILRMFK